MFKELCTQSEMVALPNRTRDFVCSTANNQRSITHFARHDNAAACVYKAQIKNEPKQLLFCWYRLNNENNSFTCFHLYFQDYFVPSAAKKQQPTANKHRHILNTIMHKHTHTSVCCHEYKTTFQFSLSLLRFCGACVPIQLFFNSHDRLRLHQLTK